MEAETIKTHLWKSYREFTEINVVLCLNSYSKKNVKAVFVNFCKEYGNIGTQSIDCWIQLGISF